MDWIKLAQSKIHWRIFVDTPQRHPLIKLQITTTEVGCEGVDWIKLAQGKIHWRIFVDTPQRHVRIKLQIITTKVHLRVSNHHLY